MIDLNDYEEIPLTVCNGGVDKTYTILVKKQETNLSQPDLEKMKQKWIDDLNQQDKFWNDLQKLFKANDVMLLCHGCKKSYKFYSKAPNALSFCNFCIFTPKDKYFLPVCPTTPLASPTANDYVRPYFPPIDTTKSTVSPTVKTTFNTGSTGWQPLFYHGTDERGNISFTTEFGLNAGKWFL